MLIDILLIIVTILIVALKIIDKIPGVNMSTQINNLTAQKEQLGQIKQILKNLDNLSGESPETILNAINNIKGQLDNSYDTIGTNPLPDTNNLEGGFNEDEFEDYIKGFK